jgi:hypothetical protein
MWPSDGSLVPGPTEPMAHRGRSGVEWSEATSLAMRAAASLSSKVRSAMPYSERTTGKAPKVSVSMASQPTARNESWSPAMTRGRVAASTS